MNILKATKRSKTEKLDFIRSNGMIPAVVYGAKIKNTPISVSSVDFIKMLKIVGETSTLTLEIDDTKTKSKVDVLIHDIQVHPVKGQPIHIDFLAIDMNKPVQVSVPIEFVGVAPADKNALGVLVKVRHELDIEALPNSIPNSIEVDLSSLVSLESQIHASDITLPRGVKMITEADRVIASITPIKEEVIEEETPEVDLSAIEVEKKGKKEEETVEEEKTGDKE